MTFHVGQKVVCVADINADCESPREPWEAYPEKGTVYTIRDIQYDRADDTTYVRLVEIINPIATYQDGETTEASFEYAYFRPVVQTDISIFTAMLRPTRVDA